jgi:hypothetical protein
MYPACLLGNDKPHEIIREGPIRKLTLGPGQKVIKLA